MLLPRKRFGLAPGLTIAAATFALGLAAGSLMAPGRSGTTIAAAAASPGIAAPAFAAAASPRYPVDVMRVVDGDTFEARVRVWPGIEIATKVRLRGIDAPELRARCPEERSQAETAREALRTMLAEGDVAIGRVGLDKYGGRVLADAATRTTPDVSAVMLAKGLARAYSGGRRDNWCGAP